MDDSACLLIVDDNPENIRIIGNILKEDGYKIALALNGREALKLLFQIDVDLILLDIMMPEMNGYEVCNKIKGIPKLNDIPVIFISALNDTDDIIKAFNSGGVDYVTKPFRAEEVRSRIATHLEIRKQKLELIKLNTDKDRFVSILSHDMKSPINGILSYLDLLLNNIHDYTINEIEKKVEILNIYAQSASTLLEETLQWAHMQSGKLSFEPQLLPFASICNEVIGNLTLAGNMKSITIEQLSTPDIYIYADSNMLKTILLNLISNAIKFTHKGGNIKVCAEQAEEGITVTVSDNGIGLSPDVASKLFDIANFHSTKGTEQESGTGFGLLLCKEFVKKHGGQIRVDSKLGYGSNFIFTLPAMKL